MKLINKKKIIFLFLVMFFVTALFFGDDAKDAAATGGDLSNYSTEELIDARDKCGPEEQQTYDNLQTEISNRDKTLAELAAETMQAENDVCDAVAEYQEEKQKIKDIKNEYEKKAKETLSISDKIQVWKERDAVIKEQKKIVREKHEQVCDTADAMKEAYKKLADAYEKYGVTGDPVRLADGSFIANYVDFEAQDFLDRFAVSRNFTKDNTCGSFGQNWTCSLDCRIIRCLPEDVSSYIQLLEQFDSCYESAKSVLDSYNQKWETKHPSEEINAALEELETEKTDFQGKINLLKEISSERKILKELNQYSAYGKYSDEKNLLGYSDYLKFVDENGSEKVFCYSGSGVWKNLSTINKSEIVIYTLDSSKKVLAENIGNGYKAVYRNGKVKYFSKYGILEKTEDRNGNCEIYYSSEGKIHSVLLKTGEIINLKRNRSGLITEISGSVSGKSVFRYKDSVLESVKDNSEVLVSFAYDNDGDLKVINKADGTCVKIGYEYSEVKGKKVCSSVTDENGNCETYTYNNGNEIVHKTTSGVCEVFRLNDLGNTIYFCGADNQESTFEVNGYGIITKESKNGFSKDYFYNESFDLEKIILENDGIETFEYNDFGDVKSHIDADNFSDEYDYDEKGNIIATRFCGNIISSIDYYPNGLIKNLAEGKRSVFYEYNTSGSVTKRIEKNTDFKWENKEEKWTYDSRNRITKYELNDCYFVTYSYEKNSSGTYDIYENHNGTKSVIRKFDERNREIERTERDLKNATSYTKKNILDGRGKIKKIYLNDVLFATFDYFPDGKISSYVIWNNCENKAYKLARQGIKTDFTYTESGFLVSKEQSAVFEGSDSTSGTKSTSDSEQLFSVVMNQKMVLEKNTYSKSGDSFFVKNSFGVYYTNDFEYDKRGLLKQVKYSDGYTKNYDYSKAGRIINCWDTSGNVWNYEYKTDGTLCIKITDGTNETKIYFYDENGLLIKATGGGETFEYFYDSCGNRVKILGPKGYFIRTYDCLGRKINEKEVSYSSDLVVNSSVEYDDKNLIQTIKVDGEVLKTNRFDAWNRITEENGACGRINYSYDVLGNCVSKQNQKGKEIRFEYSPDGNLSFISYADGGNCFYQFLPSGQCVLSKKNGHVMYKADYKASGLKNDFVDVLGNTAKLEYNSYGHLHSTTNYDTGRTVLSSYADSCAQYFKITDEYENSFVTKLEDSGKKVTESDIFGKKAVYEYNSVGQLKRKTDFSGNQTTYSYKNKQGLEQIKFWNGETASIKKNTFGNYELLETDKNSVKYEYNQKGLLTKEIDEKLKLSIYYEYDKFNRCTRKYNSHFDFSYEFDVLGRLSKICDNKSDFFVVFEYDEASYAENGSYREIKRTFSNGNSVAFGYNQFGMYDFLVLRNKSGELLKADFILYDEKGRISSIVDENGSFKSYVYDGKGRLVKSIQKWKENLELFNLQEAQECGIFLKNQEFQGDYYQLSQTEKDTFEKQLKTSGLENKIRLEENQYSWIETYTYNRNGSITEVCNPVARFIYEYDAMNRVTSKHGINSKSRGKQLSWDADGNLTEIDSCLDKRIFTYGAQKRPVKLWIYDYAAKKETFYEYQYDALGRRVLESKNGSEAYGYLYDGSSNNVIFVTPLMNDVSASANTYNQYNFLEADYDFEFDFAGTSAQNEDFSYYSEENQYKIVEGDFTAFQEEKSDSEIKAYEASPIFDARPYSLMNVGNKTVAALYMESGADDGQEFEQIFQNVFGQSVICCDEKGLIVTAADYDVWGNIVESGKNQTFSNAAVRLKTDSVMFDFGFRDYLPEVNSFTSMDLARKGSNWFGYSVCDPVNYVDQSGFYKQGLTEAQEADYAAEISDFIKYNQDEMWTDGEWKGIPVDYNCADVTAFIDNYVDSKLDIDTTSEMMKLFEKLMEKNDLKGAADQVCSAFIYEDEDGKNAIKTSDKLEDLSDPEIVTPGTVLVWGPKEKVKSGHTMTVLARKFDADGNIIGFTYIEGHLSVSKLTELGYCTVYGTGLITDIYAWLGEYEGTFELNGINTRKDCSK